MKTKYENKYRIQSRNEHLLNILEKDYYIELGTIAISTLNRLIKGEKINIEELIDREILVNGIGSITGSLEDDLFYQLNYLINLRLKNSTYKLVLTAGTIKYYDDKECEKYAPLVLIPFDYNLHKTEILVSSKPLINMKIINYLEKQAKTNKEEITKFKNDLRIRKINNVMDIDRFCLDIAKITNSTVNPTNYFTLCYIEYEDLNLSNDFMTPERSIFEMSEKQLTNLYFQQIKAILPTNYDQKYVLIKANEGDNFAINGRLGSGKTYTIINLIADQLFKNKKILYLNQDIDCIFELYQKLNSLGLGSFVYNLAKNITTNQETIELYEHNTEQNFDPSVIKELFQRIENAQKRIHGFSIFSILEHLAILKRENPNIKPITIETVLERHEALLIYNELVQIEKALGKIDLYASNIWHRLHTAYNNITKLDIIYRIEDLSKINLSLYDNVKKLSKKYRFEVPTSIDALYNLIKHIYNFVSIRPLPSWKEKANRDLAKDSLSLLQTFIEKKYALQKYYNQNISKQYEKGKMEVYLKEILAKHLDINEDVAYINKLLAPDTTLLKLNKHIRNNIEKMYAYSQVLLEHFHINELTDDILVFIKELTKYLEENILNYQFAQSYLDIPSVFTKNGDIIASSYKQFASALSYVTSYFNNQDNLIINRIEECYNKSNLDRAISSLLNRGKIRKDKKDIKQVIEDVKKYYQCYKDMQNGMSNIFGTDEYELSIIEEFASFYSYISILTPRQMTIFRNFLEDYKIANYSDKFLKSFIKDLKNFKNESYQTSSICTKLKDYNIKIEDENVMNKITSLQTWGFYLMKMEKLVSKIYDIFNQKEIVTYTDLSKLIENDKESFTLIEKLNENEEIFTSRLGRYYNGLDTVTNAINQTLDHYDDFLKHLLPNCLVDDLFLEKNYDNLFKEVEEIEKEYINWISAYRTFAVCFKGGQPGFNTNTFEQNIKLFNQFIAKQDQIEPILEINSLTEHFLSYKLKDLHDGIRSCKYGIGVSKQLLHTLFTKYLNEYVELYPEILSMQETGKLIESLNIYEKQFCYQNLVELQKKAKLNKRSLNVENGVDFNEYNKIVENAKKYFSVILADLDIFNSNLDLSVFDLVIIDDAHLSSANKYNRISECKQVVVFGDQSFTTSVSNVLMRRLPAATIFDYKRRYVQMSSCFNNAWNYNNQYIYTYSSKNAIIKVPNFEAFIAMIVKSHLEQPDHVINILVGKEETRRNAYTELIIKLENTYTPLEIGKILNNKIRIINALREGNRYVNDVYVYFNDFKDLYSTEMELVFKNFISVQNSISICYLANRVKSKNDEIEAQINNEIGKPQMFEKQPVGITELLIKDLENQGAKIDLGFGLFDFVIRNNNQPIGVMVIGKENDSIHFIVDDYLYYHNEYLKRGYMVKTVYTLDLYKNYQKVIDDLLDMVKEGNK